MQDQATEKTEDAGATGKKKLSRKAIWIIVGSAIAALVATALIVVFVVKPFDSEPAAEEAASTSEVTPSTTDPMEVIANYEAFMMEYADYLEMLNSDQGIPSDKVEEYADWIAQFDDINAQLNAVNDVELTEEQQEYFDEVIDRVDARLKEASGDDLIGIPRTEEEAEAQAEARASASASSAGTATDDASSDESSADSAE